MKKDRKAKSRGGRGAKSENAAPAAIPAGARIAIEPLKRDPNLRRISAAGNTAAILSASEVSAVGILEGAPWNDELGRKIQEALDRARARATAMKLLSTRGLSSEEVRQRLQKRGYSESIAGTVVTELETNGWIDEKALAESVVRETARKGPASTDFVRRRLRNRGVGHDAAKQATVSEAAPASGLADAEKFARKRLAKMDAELKPSTKARRIARALAGRGFDDDAISTILNRIDLGGSNDHD